MIRTVLDTNILVSAQFWKGKPHQITLRAIQNRIEAFASREILEEFRKALGRDFGISKSEIDARVETLLGFIRIIEPKTRINVISEDPSDNRILEAALEANAGYIVSGDRHLLKLKEFRGIKIVAAAEFIKLIG
ncbi:MAG: putative toxin-antitoxin system toxin component, PIN family [archaeon]